MTPTKPSGTRLRTATIAGAIVISLGTITAREVTRKCPECIECPAAPAAVLPIILTEYFDDANLAARGFYDNSNVRVSDGMAEFRFLQGASLPTSGGSIRIPIQASESVQIRYRVRYSDNWIGSGQPYHPHEFYLLTTSDGRYANPARTHLTVYIEQNAGRPVLILQDGLNIGTPLGAVAGCDPNDPCGSICCYGTGAARNNVRSFSDAPPALTPGSWHVVEATVRMNDVGASNGLLRMAVDGVPLIEEGEVELRRTPGQKFNQLMIGPYIGTPGSPIEQTFWIDDLVVRGL